MRIVVQRVKNASVSVANSEIGTIGQGFLLFVGIHENDSTELAKKFADKVAKMRIFSDQNDKMNLAIKDISGSILSVSQFTLLANTKHGNRPSFGAAMHPEKLHPCLIFLTMSLEKMIFMLKLVNLVQTCR